MRRATASDAENFSALSTRVFLGTGIEAALLHASTSLSRTHTGHSGLWQ